MFDSWSMSTKPSLNRIAPLRILWFAPILEMLSTLIRFLEIKLSNLDGFGLKSIVFLLVGMLELRLRMKKWL